MGGFVHFPSTFWTTLLGSPDRARQELFNRYRAPLFAFIRNQGFGEHDAEDLTQEVFLRASREGFLRKADRAKGKFRSLLLSVARHVILKERDRRSRQKAPPRSEDPGDAEFDALWLKNLVDLALQRLAGESAAGGPRYYDAVLLSHFRGLSYAEIAREFGVGIGDVRNWIHYGKKKIKRYLIDEIRSYCSGEQEVAADIELLRGFLKEHASLPNP